MRIGGIGGDPGGAGGEIQCSPGLSLAELEQIGEIRRRGRRRYNEFSDSLAGVTNIHSILCN